MRVMVFVKATEDSEAGVMPPTEMFEAMMKFNEELVSAGIMMDGDGLKPSVHGKFWTELVVRSRSATSLAKAKGEIEAMLAGITT